VGKIHLYTVWNPNLHNLTIHEHISVINREAVVKWLVLYDENTYVIEKGQPSNFQAFFVGNMIFRSMLNDKDIKKLNAQAKKSETLLFIQCMNIFHGPLHAGKIIKIEKLSGSAIDKYDPLIPEFYYDVFAEKKLSAYYAITLSHIKKINYSEIENLRPEPTFQSQKHQFPYPFIVTQIEPKLLFENTVKSKIDILEIVFDRHYFIKRPLRTPAVKLSNTEIRLITCFAGKEISMKSADTLAKKLKFNIDYIYNIISKLNSKFIENYDRKLFESNRGKYEINARQIICSRMKPS